jgi:hypothetical protein
VRSGPGEARTILLLHIISVRPSKQPIMVRTFLKVYMELGSYFLFLQEQIKDMIILRLLRRGLYFYYNRAAIGLACAEATATRIDIAPHKRPRKKNPHHVPHYFHIPPHAHLHDK